MDKWLNGSMKSDLFIGVSEGIDNILSMGEIRKYKEGIAKGYWGLSDCRQLSSKEVRRSLLRIQKDNEEAFEVLCKTKDPFAW